MTRQKLALALPCLMALLFIWSIPNLLALRHVLLAVSLLLLWPDKPVALGRQFLAAARWPVLIYLALSLWLVLQAWLISPEPSWAFGEIRGQWLMGLVAGLLGLFLAELVLRREGSAAARVMTSLAGVLFLQAAIVVVNSLVYWARDGSLLRMDVPLTSTHLEMSFILNTLLAILAVDLLCRALRRPPLLLLATPATIFATGIVLAAAYLAGARNGVPGVLFLTASAFLIYVFLGLRQVSVLKASGLMAAALVLMLGFAYANYQGDQRWLAFTESARYGWDIDAHPSWINIAKYPLPSSSNGQSIDESAYLRVSWWHAGLRLVAENPLGIGYGRNAFGHALRHHRSDVGVGHAHSGIIDLAVGGGVPAAILWLCLAGSLALIGARRYVREADAYGLLLAFLALGYTGRMFVDSVNRDHLLQIFMFLVCYLLMVGQPPRAASSAVPAA